MKEPNRTRSETPDREQKQFIMLPWFLVRSPRVSLTAKVLLAVLADHKRRTGRCNPRILKLTEELAVSKRTINRSLTELSSLGFIRITWGQRTSDYDLAPETEWPKILKRQIGATETRSETPNWRYALRQIGATDATLSLYEPEVLNQKEEPPIPPSICASDDARVGESALTKNRRSADGYRPEWFDQWWAIYWRKVAKKPAQKAFQKAVKTPERFEQVMAATRAQTPTMMAREPDKRPHGATWINGERWNDEPSTPAKKPPERQSAQDRLKAMWARNLAEGKRPL
jgi:hypothetical protein